MTSETDASTRATLENVIKMLSSTSALPDLRPSATSHPRPFLLDHRFDYVPRIPHQCHKIHAGHQPSGQDYSPVVVALRPQLLQVHL